MPGVPEITDDVWLLTNPLYMNVGVGTVPPWPMSVGLTTAVTVSGALFTVSVLVSLADR